MFLGQNSTKITPDEQEQAMCKGEMREQDIAETLKKKRKKKEKKKKKEKEQNGFLPGSNGLTTEFFSKFSWARVKNMISDLCNYLFEAGHVSRPS